MVGALAGDNPFLCRFANGVEVITQQFQLGIVGVTAGVAKEYMGIIDRYLLAV